MKLNTAKFGLIVFYLLVISGCGGSSVDDTSRLDLGATKPPGTTTPAPTTTETPSTTASTSSGMISTSTSTEKMMEIPVETAAPVVEKLTPEKANLKLGFIKLTDCAPIVIAKEKGFFAEEGLEVEVIAQPNWKTLLDNVINGELDGAHMLSGQPIAATIGGVGTQADIIIPYTLDLNGNGITVSNSIWEQMQAAAPELKSESPPHPITAKSLKPVVEDKLAKGEKLQMGMVFPVSTHNYEIRYWLAAAGIHPGMYTTSDIGGRTDAQVELSVTPPPMMPATLESGNIQGYCVGEPWNQKAVSMGIGVPVTTNYDIYKNKAEKVLGVTKAWADANPNTCILMVKALLKAGKWLDEADAAGKYVNRDEACRILSKANYVGADYDIIKNSMTGFFYFQKSDKREMPDFNVFYKNQCTYPWYSDGIWFLTQMRRWGQISEAKPASWYKEMAQKIYRPDIYRKAAAILIAEGKLKAEEIPPVETDGYREPTNAFIDGKTYDPKDPIGYINSFEIGNKDPEELKNK